MIGGAESKAVTAADRAILAWQLGREPRDVAAVAVRCPFSRPAVIETPPRFSTGEPNPTLLYLTCPTQVAATSRAEAQGGVRRLRAAVKDNVELRRRLESLNDLYRRRRGSYEGDSRPEAGVGGPAGPEVASCLHAYAAALLAVMAGWLKGPGLSPQEAGAVWRELFSAEGAAWCADDRCGHACELVGDTNGPPGQTGGARRAVIDVGTISVRLLVADLVGRELRTVHRETEVTRLGEGLTSGGRLEAEAARRTAAVVRRFVRTARELGVGHAWLVGTSATREARNGRFFLRRLSEETGAVAKVLSGAEEAALTYAGVRLDMPEEPVVLDVGGGSTELMRALPGERKPGSTQGGESWSSRRIFAGVPVFDPPVVEAVSLQLGASRATERWVHSDPPASEETRAVSEEARSLLATLGDRFADAKGALVGVAGTVTTLACLDAGLQHYDGRLIHGRRLAKAAVDGWAGRLGQLTVAEVASLSCVQAGRAPVLLAGTLIVQAAMEVLARDEIVVSERDLLDGVALCGLPA